MSSLKKSFTNNFTTVANHIINDNRISLKAKGLYLYLVSKPDNWRFSADRIASQNSDGINGVKATLIELEKFGLLSRSPRLVQGRKDGFEYILYDVISPSHENHSTVTPSHEKPSTEKPLTENHSLLVIKENSKKEEDRERENILSPDLGNRFVKSIVRSTSMFPFLDQFINECSKSSNVKNKVSYRASILEALMTPTHKKHNKTILAYDDFVNHYNSNGSLPVGINIFDLIGRG